jgi:ubiquitin-like protein ATG12
MKNNVFKITAGNKFQAVIVFLRGQLGLKAGDPLVGAFHFLRTAADHDRARLTTQFTYINAAFAPAPDDTVGNLFKVSDLRLIDSSASDYCSK